MTPHCIFCSIIEGRSPARIVHRDEKVIVVEDIAPQAPHHLLIVPHKHIPTVMDIAAEDDYLVAHVYAIARKIARERGFDDKGFRVVVNCNHDGGQTVWHLHFHLLGGRHFSWPPG